MNTETKQPTRSVYQIVTDRIIALLEKGTVPWRKPWTVSGIPMNLISKHAYRGINVLLLNSLNYEHNLFITDRQLKDLGATPMKNEKPHLVIFWNWEEPKDETEAKEEAPKVPHLRYYKVYNVAQCEGIPERYMPVIESPRNPIEQCEFVIGQMPNAPKIKHKERFAYYNPLADEVNIPKLEFFESEASYYNTFFHELGHATGHRTRLNRKGLLEMAEYGADAYSFEELVAEMTASYMCSHSGIDSEIEQNAAYMQSWIAKLRNDSKMLIQASALAQKAADYILGTERDEPREEKGTEE